MKFVKKATSKPTHPKYDYIVHDVFTGGAEPIELFTVEFLEGLKSLLKDDGAIAIVSAPPPFPLYIYNSAPPN